MKHILKIFLVLVAVVVWGIDQSTPRAEGVGFSVDRHTADTVGTEDAKVPQSGIPLLHRDFVVPMLQRQDNNILTQQREDAGKGVLLPVENPKGRSPAPYDAGPSAKDFVTPDGRFDLEAIRASGYEGTLDLKGLDVGIEPRTGEPVLSSIALLHRDFVVPMLRRQDNNILTQQRISGDPDDTF